MEAPKTRQESKGKGKGKKEKGNNGCYSAKHIRMMEAIRLNTKK